MFQKLEDDAESEPARPTLLMEASSIPVMQICRGLPSTSDLQLAQIPSKLPTLHNEKKAEELLINNAALKKRHMELEEEVCSVGID